MAKYRRTNADQGMFLSIDPAAQIIPGTFEHALETVIGRMDLSSLEKRFQNDGGGAPAYPPRVLLKIILFGYSRGIVSSRRIERACWENITFMILSEHTKPDHGTIAGFVARMDAEVVKIFTEVLKLCQECGMIGGEVFAVDGCKIRSNASREMSGTHAELKRRSEKLLETLNACIKSHQESDTQEKREKQATRYRKKIDKIESFLEKESPRMGQRGNEKQSNVTDNESAKMKTSHGVMQGYNGMAMVDEKYQIVVYSEAFGTGQEQALLKPMVESTEQQMQSIRGVSYSLENKVLIADTGSFSEENLKLLASHEIDGYIPDPDFRERDERFQERRDRRLEKQNDRKYQAADFTLQPDQNSLICPNGKTLTRVGQGHQFGNSSGVRYTARQADCSSCSLREKCLKSDKVRKRTVYIITAAKETRLMKEKIDTPEGRRMYSKRMAIVEPVFANIRTHKQLDHFTYRTKQKVNVQWNLYCLVHNIDKLARFAFGKQERAA